MRHEFSAHMQNIALKAQLSTYHNGEIYTGDRVFFCHLALGREQENIPVFMRVIHKMTSVSEKFHRMALKNPQDDLQFNEH